MAYKIVVDSGHGGEDPVQSILADRKRKIRYGLHWK